MEREYIRGMGLKKRFLKREVFTEGLKDLSDRGRMTDRNRELHSVYIIYNTY